ncbi:MAG: hypothetical protein N3A69_00400 [Leptospiraceae bacterium]|nr:hypothetical protein [Leptospiraceae bacterium]
MFFFLGSFAISSEEETNEDYISKNTQVQMLIAKTFLEESFDVAEGFYDPRLGIVLYLSYKANLGCLENPSSAKAECLKERLLKLRFLLNSRRLLSQNQRVFLQIEYPEGSKLEIWKKELLDKLESEKLDTEELKFGYMSFVNGKHPTLGEYPNWERIQKILQVTQKKFISLGMESVNGMFIPAKGFIFIIKTQYIPAKKVTRLNKKLIEQLKKANLSAQYIIEYFYGGKKGELSNFIQIDTGKTQYLKFWSEME